MTGTGFSGFPDLRFIQFVSCAYVGHVSVSALPCIKPFDLLEMKDIHHWLYIAGPPVVSSYISWEHGQLSLWCLGSRYS